VKQAALVVAGLLILSGCNAGTAGGSGSLQRPGENPSQTLARARQGFSTHLIARVHDSGPVDQPPAGVFELVHYTSAVGSLAAYLTPPPGPGRHPAIIWITGGDDNSIGDVWSPAPADNDQTAAQYRDAGIMMMFPSLRGGNDNPGYEEGFMGEADDIVAAAEFLAEQPGVDPNRIYLGGHSTGGTMVLIESEYTDRFRAVFSFGPVDSPSRYDPQEIAQPWDPTNPRELYLRAPINFLGSITKPTFVFEGTRSPSNIAALHLMARKSASPNAHFYAVENHTHFSILAPVNALIAQKINADTGATCNIAFSTEELAALR